jgi:dipeptidase
MYSEDLVDFAIANGFYDPDSSEPFCFAEVYGNLSVLESPYNTRRHWRVETLLDSIVSEATPENIMSILRDHYEGTEYDLTNGYETSPHHTSERTVCRPDTETSVVVQLRNWLPAEIGGVAWWAFVAPCSSVYVPWYMGTLEVPYAYQVGTNVYDEESAYWAFSKLSHLVDDRYGELIGEVGKTWADFEAKEFQQQHGIEKAALKIYEKNRMKARSFLTEHSNRLGMQAVKKANQMSKHFEP